MRPHAEEDVGDNGGLDAGHVAGVEVEDDVEDDVVERLCHEENRAGEKVLGSLVIEALGQCRLLNFTQT